MTDAEALKRVTSIATSPIEEQFIGWKERLAIQRVVVLAHRWQAVEALVKVYDADSVSP